MIDETLQRCLILSFIILIILPPSTAAVEPNSANIFYFIKDAEFIRDISIAAVGAVLAFLFSFLLSQITERRKPRKQLSYDLEVEKGLVKIEKNIEKKVKTFYNNKEIGNLFHVICDIKNTGNQTARGHPALKDGVCFGPRARFFGIQKSSSLSCPEAFGLRN